jgi:tetratricopeptide (TPR) repeat protein
VRRAVLIAVLVTACKGSTGRPETREITTPAGGASGAKATASAAAASGPAQPAEPTHPHETEPRPLPVTECPIADQAGEDVEHLVDRLLDQANGAFDANRLGEAWTCADRAADLEPQSVEAHHLRAAALAGLGHEGEAEVAYSMALALDPEDPETLRAAADFYINVKGDKSKDSLWVGLELARRGTSRATARRRGNAPLRANLALLEGQALDDLGKSDEALARVDEALRLQPNLTDAIHERGVALFNLGKFDDARTEFTRVLGDDPDDPYAHHFLALTYEWQGRMADAAAHEKRARELDPGDFPAPIVISTEEFRAEIDRVIATLTPERKAELKGVPIEVTDLPAKADLVAVDPPFPPTILGLYRGLPKNQTATDAVPSPAPGAGNDDMPPRSIVLYRLNLARAVKTRAELNEQIERTLLHEIGHLEGLDEDDLRRRNLD